MWGLYKEKQNGKTVFIIRRWVNGTTERLSISKYKAIRDNESELKLLIIRLNQPEKSRKVVEIKHAFINTELLDKYKSFLQTQIPTQSKANAEYSYFIRYFFNYFVGKLNLANPVEWHKIHKNEWASYLLKEGPPSADTKKQIVSASNRFMAWLHGQRPTEVPPLRFQPFTRAKYKEVEAVRVLRGEKHVTKFIKDRDWEKIQKNLTSELLPVAMLAYWYGLRRSETLGLNSDDIKRGYLSVERQLVSIPKGKPLFGPLKSRKPRKVPHWGVHPISCSQWVKNIPRMHPDTLTDKWAEFVKCLGLSYTFHDLRHTWTTRNLRTQNPRDVQLAAGHESIETTMKYAHDDRTTDDEVFTG